MPSGADIFDALMQRVTSLEVGSPALPIALPEVSFKPQTDAPQGKYLDVSDFPNRPLWEGLSDGRIDQGLLQITVVWPKGRGLVQPKAAADAVIAHFPKGLVLAHGSARVKISAQPWQAQPIIGTSELRIPVTISWVAG